MVRISTGSFYSCAYILLAAQAMATVVGFKKTSDVNEYTVKNHRTRMRQDYMAPALGPDYADVMRNDIFLLDDSVQTSSGKRAAAQADGRSQGVVDVPCSCEEEGKKLLFLGEEYVPRTLETRYCDDRLCPSPYGCIIRSHNVTVLKRKKYSNELSQEELPEELKRRWVAVKRPVTVGCTCSKGYIEVY